MDKRYYFSSKNNLTKFWDKILGQMIVYGVTGAGGLTLKSDNGNTIISGSQGQVIFAVAKVTPPVTNTDWQAFTAGTATGGAVSSVALTTPTGLTVSGSPITSTGTFALTWTTAGSGFDSNNNFTANNFIPNYATTVTAAGTTTLTNASAFQQFFTGTTTQTLKMPLVSTLTVGWPFLIVNNSTGAVSIQSNAGGGGANIILSLAGGANARIIWYYFLRK